MSIVKYRESHYVRVLDMYEIFILKTKSPVHIQGIVHVCPVITVITVEPAGKASFVYSCKQMKLMTQRSEKRPICRVYVSKTGITVIIIRIIRLILASPSIASV